MKFYLVIAFASNVATAAALSEAAPPSQRGSCCQAFAETALLPLLPAQLVQRMPETWTEKTLAALCYSRTNIQ